MQHSFHCLGLAHNLKGSQAGQQGVHCTSTSCAPIPATSDALLTLTVLGTSYTCSHMQGQLGKSEKG